MIRQIGLSLSVSLSVYHLAGCLVVKVVLFQQKMSNIEAHRRNIGKFHRKATLMYNITLITSRQTHSSNTMKSRKLQVIGNNSPSEKKTICKLTPLY